MAQKRILDFFGKPQQNKKRNNRELEEADSQSSQSTPETRETAASAPDCDDDQNRDRSCAPADNVPGQNANLSEASHQPASFSFLGRQFGKETFCRSFNASWFTKWRWLHYTEDGDRVVCFNCVTAVGKGLINEESVRLDSCFVKGGFTNWRKATEKSRSSRSLSFTAMPFKKSLL